MPHSLVALLFPIYIYTIYAAKIGRRAMSSIPCECITVRVKHFRLSLVLPRRGNMGQRLSVSSKAHGAYLPALIS
jgi:hypothetical protein